MSTLAALLEACALLEAYERKVRESGRDVFRATAATLLLNEQVKRVASAYRSFSSALNLEEGALARAAVARIAAKDANEVCDVPTNEALKETRRVWRGMYLGAFIDPTATMNEAVEAEDVARALAELTRSEAEAAHVVSILRDASAPDGSRAQTAIEWLRTERAAANFYEGESK